MILARGAKAVCVNAQGLVLGAPSSFGFAFRASVSIFRGPLARVFAGPSKGRSVRAYCCLPHENGLHNKAERLGLWFDSCCTVEGFSGPGGWAFVLSPLAGEMGQTCCPFPAAWKQVAFNGGQGSPRQVHSRRQASPRLQSPESLRKAGGRVFKTDNRQYQHPIMPNPLISLPALRRRHGFSIDSSGVQWLGNAPPKRKTPTLSPNPCLPPGLGKSRNGPLSSEREEG